jgi:serine/threonine protein kinase
MEYALKNYDSDCLDLINENQEFKTILHKCLQIDYKKRPTAEELFNDPFFSGYTKPY